MGYMAHDVVIVTTWLSGDALPDVAAFRDSLPEDWRHLIIGPVPGNSNGYVSYVFLPDGSKEGWEYSQAGDDYRLAFVDLFKYAHEDGSSPYDVVGLRFGGDYGREAKPETWYVWPERKEVGR